MTEAESHRWLNEAKRIAVEAGRLLTSGGMDLRSVEGESSHDTKIEADRRANQLITDSLRRASGFSIMSEESEFEKRSGELTWIVDPLDGTVNYLRGLPMSCVSIALWKGQEALLGVVHDFNQGHTYSGIVGVGAWLGEEPMVVSDRSDPSESILCTGMPAGNDFSEAGLRRFLKPFQDYKKVRLLGSAALSLAYVAKGRVDAYRENRIRLWDVAAGVPLVLAAKGKVKLSIDVEGEYCDLVAWNGQWEEEGESPHG